MQAVRLTGRKLQNRRVIQEAIESFLLMQKFRNIFLILANVCWLFLILIGAALLKVLFTDFTLVDMGRLLLLVFPAGMGLLLALQVQPWSAPVASLCWLVTGLVCTSVLGFNTLVTFSVFMAVPVCTLGYGQMRITVEMIVFTILTVLVLGILAIFSPFSLLFAGALPLSLHQNAILVVFFIAFSTFFLFNVLALKETQLINWVRRSQTRKAVPRENSLSGSASEVEALILFDRRGEITKVSSQTIDFFLKSLEFVFSSGARGQAIQDLHKVLKQKKEERTGTEKETRLFAAYVLEKYCPSFAKVKAVLKSGKLKPGEEKAYSFLIQEKKALSFTAVLAQGEKENFQLRLTPQKDISWLIAERDHARLEAKSKAEYLANMSHELRTPLNAIIGFSEIMKTRLFGPIPEKYSDYIDLTYTSGRHLLDLIGDVLDLSKIEADKYTLNYEVFDIKILAESCYGMLRTSAKDKKINLIAEYKKEPLEINADRTACRQVILNLLSNAIKYTPEKGEVHIDVKARENSFEIRVWDTGVGMSEEEVSHIGSPYEQVKSHHSSEDRGTGLGLSLVKKLIQKHQGKFEIKSVLGKGTDIRLTLPITQPKR